MALNPSYTTLNSKFCLKIYSLLDRSTLVAQSCPTLSDPMDWSLPGSSVHGIFQARVLDWGAIAFSEIYINSYQMSSLLESIVFLVCQRKNSTTSHPYLKYIKGLQDLAPASFPKHHLSTESDISNLNTHLIPCDQSSFSIN